MAALSMYNLKISINRAMILKNTNLHSHQTPYLFHTLGPITAKFGENLTVGLIGLCNLKLMVELKTRWRHSLLERILRQKFIDLTQRWQHFLSKILKYHAMAPKNRNFHSHQKIPTKNSDSRRFLQRFYT